MFGRQTWNGLRIIWPALKSCIYFRDIKREISRYEDGIYKTVFLNVWFSTPKLKLNKFLESKKNMIKMEFKRNLYNKKLLNKNWWFKCLIWVLKIRKKNNHFFKSHEIQKSTNMILLWNINIHHKVLDLINVVYQSMAFSLDLWFSWLKPKKW